VAARYIVPDHATIGWFVPIDPAAAAQAAEAEAAAAKAAPAATGMGNGATAAAHAAGASTRTEPASAPASSTRAASGSEPFAKRTVHRVLKNGLTVDVVENHAVPTVAIQATILAGTMHAPAGKPALSQFTASMLDRGTKTK